MILLSKKHKLTSVAFNQAGLALPLTLMLLFVMTLIAVATLRTTTQQENMSANTRLRQIAFNAGETALIEAERAVQQIRYERELFIGAHLTPDPLIANRGDLCLNGFCTPAQFTSDASTAPNGERWEDPDLDVWNEAGRHIEYENFANTDLINEGVLEAPKYIIEFLGNYDYKDLNERIASARTDRSISGKQSRQVFRPKFDGPFKGNCRDLEESNELSPPNNVWPFCAADPAVYRITVRATAGPEARQSIVLLQSTLVVP